MHERRSERVSDDDDREARAFREAMRDVRRLRRGAKAEPAGPKPPAKARFTRADQVEVLRESLLPPPDEAVLATGDELSFRRPHISEAVLTRLRRGAYVVDSEIDLHGMTGAKRRRRCADSSRNASTIGCGACASCTAKVAAPARAGRC